MIDLIRKRLDEYQVGNPLDEENALKEIMQEILLFALSRVNFFDIAAFQGGTSLRVIHQLPRFSEDIDFILKTPDPDFSWSKYWKAIVSTCNEFGIQPEALEPEKMDRAVKAAVLKDNSIARQLNLEFLNHQPSKKLKIKLEIDTNPPMGSGFDYSFLTFPVDYEICHQDLSSNFALKIHALLCRGYLKGRDWYDFSWYVTQGVKPNMSLLQNALVQYGSWQGEDLNVDHQWLIDELKKKIASIDWDKAADDVARFLRPVEQSSLSIWSERFFNSKVDKLSELM